jgi:hypothetical protein
MVGNNADHIKLNINCDLKVVTDTTVALIAKNKTAAITRE